MREEPRPFDANVPPSAWVARFAPVIRSGGRVLDLAAGTGRHTRLMLARGHEVTAVDRDISALTAEFAAAPRCRVTALDLEDGGVWRLGGGWDGIIVANYLHRPLLPDLASALAPDGVLIYETFMRGNERFGRPRNPDFLLEPGELLRAFGQLTVAAFEQGIVEQPHAAVIQRIAAVNGIIDRPLIGPAPIS